jgi:hypothetical protein
MRRTRTQLKQQTSTESADAVGGSVLRKTTKASRIGWSVGVTARRLENVCRYPNTEREKPMAKKTKKKRRTSKSSGSDVKSECDGTRRGPPKAAVAERAARQIGQ